MEPHDQTTSAGARVRIHINREPHESANPTIGAELYKLGKIPPGQQLYREVQGDEEDEPIFDDGEFEHLRQDEHFYSEERRHPGIEIIVNASPEHVGGKRASYEEVVRLAHLPPPPPGTVQMFTVTFYNGPKENPEGPLTAGHTVRLKNKMVFNVKTTNRS